MSALRVVPELLLGRYTGYSIYLSLGHTEPVSSSMDGVHSSALPSCFFRNRADANDPNSEAMVLWNTASSHLLVNL